LRRIVGTVRTVCFIVVGFHSHENKLCIFITVYNYDF